MFKLIFKSIFVVILFVSINTPVFAKVGEKTHTTYVSKLRKLSKSRNPWGVSANVKTAAWIETFILLEGSSMLINHNFINDRRRKGYTGCVTLSIYGPKKEILIQKTVTRGLKPTGIKGRKTRPVSDKIELSEALRKGISSITVRQYHCSSDGVIGDIIQGVKDFTKGFGKAPVMSTPPDQQPQDVKSVAIQNCGSDRATLYLWYKNVGTNQNFINYGSFPTNWQGSSCPNGTIKQFKVPSKGTYRVRLVQPSSEFCAKNVNDPNLLGCIKMEFFVKGDPSSPRKSSVRF